MAAPDISEVFSKEWPRLVAIILRDFGDLELAEDCAQEAFLTAATAWAESGVPDKPAAWLLTAARRKAIDRLRRTTRYKDKLQLLEAQARSASSSRTPDGLIDDQLGLVLGCCHPALNREAQVALTLRAVAGLSTAQIASAFLVPEATMGKRLTRARNKIRDANIPFSVPDRDLLQDRLEQVREVIYLIFTEGHASSTDAALVRGDLCDEALWLSELVVDLVAADSETLSLAALIRLTDARREARTDASGMPVLLEDQDRLKWDRKKIDSGLSYLARARQAGSHGTLFFQASVAAVHCVATRFSETDWAAIVALYDRQIQLGPTPVLRLNRAAAVAFVDGPAKALAEIDQLSDDLGDYVYFHSARGELLRRLGRNEAAVSAYNSALNCGPGESQRKFLLQKRALVLASAN